MITYTYATDEPPPKPNLKSFSATKTVTGKTQTQRFRGFKDWQHISIFFFKCEASEQHDLAQTQAEALKERHKKKKIRT